MCRINGQSETKITGGIDVDGPNPWSSFPNSPAPKISTFDVDEDSTTNSPAPEESATENTEPEDSTSNNLEDSTIEVETIATIDIPEPTSPPTIQSVELSKTLPKFICRGNGRFPHPTSCSKYYYCWDTVHKYAIFNCPNVFDPISNRCDDNYALCPLIPKCTADEQLFPVPEEKTAYLQCELENENSSIYQIRKKECGKGRQFDKQMGYCRLITVSDWSSSENLPILHECEAIGKFIDFMEETHYIECKVESISKGTLKAIRRKCPKYKVFSGDTKKCVPLQYVSK